MPAFEEKEKLEASQLRWKKPHKQAFYSDKKAILASEVLLFGRLIKYYCEKVWMRQVSDKNRFV